jgi:hypothetical protein
MLHRAVSFARLRRRQAWKVVWLWCLTLIAISFAPVPQQVAQHVVSVIAENVDDCADDCEEGDCCPGPCEACHCCVHVSALALVPLELPGVPAAVQLVGLYAEGRQSTGYATPPFRPPTT